MIWTLLLACSTLDWTPAGAVAPHRVALDDDGDGRVTAAEYDRRRWEGPGFAGADGDGDGDLGVDELLALVRNQSATAFDGVAVTDASRPTRAPWSLPTAERDTWEALAWMADALQAAGQPGPDPAAIDDAVRSGRLDSPRALPVLATLAAGWQAQGWSWPEGLPPLASLPAADPAAATDADASAVVAARVRTRLWGAQGAEVSGGSGSDTTVPGAQ